jgi:dipeptidyl aminopeptidase/acylaminoacyl peptidase
VERAKEVEVKWSKDGSAYTYAKDGRLFLGTLDGKEERQLAGPAQKKPDAKPSADAGKTKTDAEKKAEARERFTLVAFDPAAQWILASNTDGFWRFNAGDGSKKLVIVSDADTSKVTYRYERMTPDGRKLLFRSSAGDRWQRGIHIYDPSSDNLATIIDGESNLGTAFGSPPRMSDDGNTIVFVKADGSRPGDVYVTQAGAAPRRLTQLNPALDDPRTSRVKLVPYLDSDGRREYGVLYLPWNYEEGKSYPTVFHLYEKFFDPEFEGWDQLLVAKGYAVIRPSVPTNTEHGYENEAWMKGAMAAATKLVEMGIADSSRMGVYGCSYGGYATNFMVTQTKRFKAAVAISGMVNVVSLYTESPRLGLRNMNATEGRAQVRIGGTLWEQPEKYVSNSSIMQADRVQTPLLIITGGWDHNVEPNQSAAMFYALRRLGKEVKWVNFPKGGHCGPYGSEEELRNYTNEIVGWFDNYLTRK